jgi:sugar lactone lactonase YvrE
VLEPELVLDLHADLLEGPVWDAARARLLFVDIMRGHVHEFDPATSRDRILDVGQPVGAVTPTSRGDWVVAAWRGFCRVDPETGRTSVIAEVEADRDDTRMNDGYVDPRGRLWAGTMSVVKAPEQGALYRLDPDGSVRQMLAPVTTSNGIDWSADGRLMYYVDTPTHRVDVFDFDADRGEIRNRRAFVTIPESAGRPDGLVVDAEGGIWLALFRGSAVHRYRPDGSLDLVIRFPVSLTTKPAFGGADLGDLFVTTASSALDASQRAAEPQAGGLFRLRPGVRGRPANLFAG